MLNKFSSCEVSALKINNAVEHDRNSVLGSLKNYYSTLAENLVKMLPKARNKYSINTVIKYHVHMIQCYHFNLTSISKNLILTILEATQVSKVAGLDSLSRRYIQLVIYVISQLTLKNFLTFAKQLNLIHYTKRFPNSTL